MKIVTVQFNYEDFYDYKLLLDVFKKSCERFMPKADFVEIRTPAPEPVPGRARNFTYNTFKLQKWIEVLESTDEEIVFADCDMLANNDCSTAFNFDFDVAYTERTTIKRIPMNGGIVFVKPNERSRQFFRTWLKKNEEMLLNPTLHAEYREKWAGMNQSAFGWMIDHPTEWNANLIALPTRKWNAVDCDWGAVDQDTVFIHFKSKLRRWILSNLVPQGDCKLAMELWYETRRMI